MTSYLEELLGYEILTGLGSPQDGKGFIFSVNQHLELWCGGSIPNKLSLEWLSQYSSESWTFGEMKWGIFPINSTSVTFVTDQMHSGHNHSFLGIATDILLDSFYQYGTGTSKVLWGGWVHKPDCDRLNAFRMPPAPRPAPRYSYWHSLGGLLSIRYRHLKGPARWVGSWMHFGCHLPLGAATGIFLGGLLSIQYKHLEGPARWVGS